MLLCRLQLNPAKTEFILSGARRNLAKLSDECRSLTVCSSVIHCADVLHWLPVRQRVTFKTAVIVFKCLHAAVPDRVVQTDII